MSRVYKAHGEAVPDLEIIALDPIPTDDLSMEAAQAIYAEQGRVIATDLWASLPGGTLDWLLVEMMQRRASMLCGTFTRKPGC